MKTAAFGMTAFITTVLTIVIVLTFTTKGELNNDIERQLSVATESALNSAMLGKNQTKDLDELYQRLTDSLRTSISNEAELTVNIIDADLENGLLSVEVIGKYKKLNGKDEEVRVTKTVILEEKEQIFRNVTFQTDDFVYRKYELSPDHNIIIPQDPVIVGKIFKYWTLDGVQIDNSTIKNMKADKDYIFIAEFE